jgi:ribosome silencing factor RsfS/YbeB/iojap/nicotinate (nicotinamide) nucleotide adenylyltransferase
VWWLVSPQNPLKPAIGMAPFAERLVQATKTAAADRRILVTDIEATLGSRYTADTLKELRRRFPRARFVWLMGGDNLVQFPHWHRWQDIFATMPIAVFNRPGTSATALAGLTAQRFARARVPAGQAHNLASMPRPAWVFLHAKLDPGSATRIRAERLAKVVKERQPPVKSEPVITALRSRQRPNRGPELLRRVLDSLEDGKAEDIVTIDLAGKTTIADYMVIASGRSGRQVMALTDHLEQALPGRIAVEGKTQGDWVLVDAGDVIVHIFRPEIRAYYNLEKMWGSALPDLDVEVARQ